MERVKLAVAEAELAKAILLCVGFIGLNILDAWLTGIALRLGSYELNPLLGIRFGSNMLVKGLISAEITAALVLSKRGRLLKPLNVGIFLVCCWNGLAILSWV